MNVYHQQEKERRKEKYKKLIEEVFNKYEDQLYWGDRSNNMDWLNDMINDLVSIMEAQVE